MAYALAAVSANSWQLQRSSGLGPFAPLPRRVPRGPHYGVKRVGCCPIRPSAIAGNGEGKDGRKPKPPETQSWVEADSSLSNGYSGWFSSDQNPVGNKFTGYLAAGAAGLVLTIGFSFASHSFFSRRGVKNQVMVPLTVTQETVLSSEDSNSSVVDHEVEQENVISADAREQNDVTAMRTEDINDLHKTAGTNKSSVSLEETNGMRFEDVGPATLSISTPNVELVESKTDAVDLVPNTNDKNVAFDPLSVSTLVAKSEIRDGLTVVPQSDPSSVLTSESANHASSLVESYSETKSVSETYISNGVSSTLYSETGTIFQNVDTESSVVLPVSGSASVNVYSDTQNAEMNLEEGENSMERTPTDFEVSHQTYPSDSVIPEPIPEPTTPPKPGINQHSSANPSHVSEAREIKQIISNNESSLVSETIPITAVNDFSESALTQKLSTSGLNETHDAVNLVDTDGIDLNSRTSTFESLISSDSEHSFPSPGIPAPSYPAIHVAPGKVVVPPVVDHLQGQAFAALQALKVVEAGVEPNSLCTRREYARWLIASSAILTRNSVSKVFPAMFIENVTELAFDDITPEDPDFPSVQGLAEAGLISSKLSNHDTGCVEGGKPNHYLFSPDSPLSRQDLLCWKVALEKKQLPEANRKILWEKSGFIDIDKIHQDAWPALLADILLGDQSVIGVAFGHTRLFQPDKPVTKAQAAIALATGEAAELVSEELARLEAESLADTAVAEHAALEAQVQKDLNDSFERELEAEREKVKVTERLAEDARVELERIKAGREEEKYILMKEQAAIDSEREFLSKLRNELEQQLQILSTNKLEISFEKDQVERLKKEAEDEKEALVRIRSEVEIEKKALALARAWAEEEAKQARALAKVLKEAREKWENQGIQVKVDKDLNEDNIPVSTWQYSPELQKNLEQSSAEVHKASGDSPLQEILVRAEEIKGKLLLVSHDLRVKISAVIENLVHAIGLLIISLRQKAGEARERAQELEREALAVTSQAVQNVQQSTATSVAGVTSSIKEGTKRLADEFREGAEKISQKFKT